MSLAVLARRTILGAGLALAALATRAAVPINEPGDMALGAPSAPVTVVEYASVGCPHCAAWALNVFPALRRRFIDTGKARLVVRVMLTGDPALASAGFMLVRCAGPAKYFQVMGEIYHRQADIFQSGDAPGPVLQQIAGSVGMGPASFRACLDSQKGLIAVNALNDRHLNEDKVDLTPTFFVGDRRFEGDVTLDQLAEAICAARRGR